MAAMETRVDMVVKKKEEVEQKLTEVEKQLEHANKENETLKEKISKVLYNVQYIYLINHQSNFLFMIEI